MIVKDSYLEPTKYNKNESYCSKKQDFLLRAFFLHIIVVAFVCLPVHYFGQLEFIQNGGQWPEQVEFKAALPAGSMFVESSQITYAFHDPAINDHIHPRNDGEPQASLELFKSHAYRVEFLDALSPITSSSKETKPYYNYFLGNNSDNWASGMKGFQKITKENLYEEIDLIFYSKGNAFKYDFIVKPNGNSQDILMEFDGLEDLSIHEGNFVINTSVNTVTELEPYAFQLINGKIVDIDCSFVLEGKTLSFEIGDYNPNYDLVIDPEVTFASYIGSPADNFGYTASNDSDGNLIGGGIVFGDNYPTTLGAVQSSLTPGGAMTFDCAISKFSADGSNLLYSTYMGGENQEMPHSIIVDSQDDIIIMGNTGSLTFPSTAGAYNESYIGGPITFIDIFGGTLYPEGSDIFVSKLSGDGTGLLGSTFVGGSDMDGLNTGDKLFYNYGDLARGEVTVDSDDNIIVSSTTTSSDFPTVGAIQNNYGGGGSDAVIFKLDPNLNTMLWSSYLGGSQDDAGYSVQVDSDGNLIAAGGTKSSNLNTSGNSEQSDFGGDVDGYIAKIDISSNSLEALTYVGTSEYDQCYFVQLDADDKIYVIGQTEGDMPIVGNVYNNPSSGQFIRKYDAALSSIEWSTTIGTGSSEIDISPSAFLVSDCKQIYVSGWGGLTNSFSGPYASYSSTTGMPVTDDAYQAGTDGSDFYLCVLSADAEDLVYATFFGGGISNEHVDGGTSKFDKDGSVYQAVCAGCGGNSDFPTTPGAWSQTNNSTNCNLGVFKFDLGAIAPSIAIDGPSTLCEGLLAQFINNSTGGNQYLWDFGDGETSTLFEPSHEYQDFGFFTITLTVMDEAGCLEEAATSIEIEILEGVDPSIEDVDPICEGDSVELNGSGSENLYWLDDPTLDDTSIPNPTVTPVQATSYYLVDFNDCETDTVAVIVDFVDINTNISSNETICAGQSVELFVEGGVSYSWSPTESLQNPNTANPIASPIVETIYTVDIVTAEGCETEESVTVFVDIDFPGGEIYPDEVVCINSSVQLSAESGLAWTWSPDASLSDPSVQNPMAFPLDTTTYYVEITNACGSGISEVTVNVIIPSAEAGDDGQVCLNSWYPVWASGGIQYSWQPANFVDHPTWAAPSVSPPESMTFTVEVTDSNNCSVLESVYVNVLPLPIADAGPDQYVDWLETTYIYGYANGIDYWWEPDLYLECTDCYVPEVWPDEVMTYTLYTIDEQGCVNSDSVLVEVFFPIYVPNTFTPDGDGINDFFFAYGENIRDFRMEIRDRWGELIFISEDIEQPWDGSVRNGDYYVQIGTYVWTVHYRSHKGIEKLIGHVNVVR